MTSCRQASLAPAILWRVYGVGLQPGTAVAAVHAERSGQHTQLTGTVGVECKCAFERYSHQPPLSESGPAWQGRLGFLRRVLPWGEAPQCVPSPRPLYDFAIQPPHPLPHCRRPARLYPALLVLGLV